MPEVPRPRDLVLGSVGAFAAGVLVGVLGTFKHQFGVSAATGTGWPIGLVASLAMVGLLLAALRIVFPGRLLALSAAIGAVATGAILLLPGPGGSRVVLLNSAGIVWALGPAVLSAVIVAWPRRRSSETPDGILDGRREQGEA